VAAGVYLLNAEPERLIQNGKLLSVIRPQYSVPLPVRVTGIPGNHAIAFFFSKIFFNLYDL
jgi:hypothetical protein